MVYYNVILELPWFKKHNPWVNQEIQKIEFWECGCIPTLYPVNQQHLTTDKKNDLLLIKDISKKKINKNLIQPIRTKESVIDTRNKKD